MFKVKNKMAFLIVFTCFLLLGLPKPRLNFHLSEIKNKVNIEPKDGQYFSDEFLFLKTYYLMKKGRGYYESFNYAIIKDGRNIEKKGQILKSVWQWRWPFNFYLWKFLTKNGEGILNLFILFSAITLISSFFIAKKFLPPHLALLPPFLLFPYFLDVFEYKTSFLFTEWWGLFFFILAIVMLLYKRKILATLFFSLTVIIRELFIISVFTMFFLSLIFKKDRIIFLIAILVFLGGLILHIQHIRTLNGLNTSFDIYFQTGLHGFNKLNLLKRIAFSSRQYLLIPWKTNYFLILFGIGGLVIDAVRHKFKNLYPCLLGLFSFLPFLIINPFLGTVYNDYWGVVFMPLTIIFSPTILSVFYENRH